MCHRPAQLEVFAFSSMSLSCALAPAAIFKMRCSDRLSPRSGRVRHHLRKPLVRRPSVNRFFNPFRRPLSRTRLSGGLVRITCFGRPLEPFQARCKSSPEATVKSQWDWRGVPVPRRDSPMLFFFPTGCRPARLSQFTDFLPE